MVTGLDAGSPCGSEPSLGLPTKEVRHRTGSLAVSPYPTPRKLTRRQAFIAFICDADHVLDREPHRGSWRRNSTPAPQFPADVLGSTADWVKTTAAVKCAPVSYVALATLVTDADYIGPKRRVSPWNGWDEPSILWGAQFDDPSTPQKPGDAAFPAMEGQRPDAIIVQPSLPTKRAADLAFSYRIAAVCAWRQFPNDGGLAVSDLASPPNWGSTASINSFI